MSQFAKRHYETIASAMQAVHPTYCIPPEGTVDAVQAQWDYTVSKLADRLAADNGLFKRDRFIRACQPGANVRART